MHYIIIQSAPSGILKKTGYIRKRSFLQVFPRKVTPTRNDTMHLNNVLAKAFLAQADVFADAFNNGVFHGKKVISPEGLREVTPEELFVPMHGESLDIDELDRDFLKVFVYKQGTKEETTLLLGIEIQSPKDYNMPIRLSCYDAIRYHQQMRTSTGGLPVPIITLFLYLGPDKWTAPRSIHEILNIKDPELRKLVPDYKINIIEPYALSAKAINRFTTSLAPILLTAKYAKNPKKLRYCLAHTPRMKNIPRNAIPLMWELGNFGGPCPMNINLENVDDNDEPRETFLHYLKRTMSAREKKAMNKRIRKEIKEELRPEVREELRPQVLKELRPEVHEELKPVVREEVEIKIFTEMNSKLRIGRRKPLSGKRKTELTESMKQQIMDDLNNENQVLGFISACRLLNVNDALIKKKLQEQYHMSSDKAAKYLALELV